MTVRNLLFEGTVLTALQTETPLRLAFGAREEGSGWKSPRVVFWGGGGGGMRGVAAWNRRVELQASKKKQKTKKGK